METVREFAHPKKRNGHFYCPFCASELEVEFGEPNDENSLLPASDYYECTNCAYYWVADQWPQLKNE